MAILLDTHCLLWLVTDDGRLGARAREALDAEEVLLWSAVSLAELRIKEMQGRIALPASLLEAIEASGIQRLEYTLDDADALTRFPELVRHDLFDGMLLAQAAARGCRLLTADDVLLAMGLAFLLDARR